MTTKNVATRAMAKELRDSKSNSSPSPKSQVGDFDWDAVLIPENAGKGTMKWRYQRRTLMQYSGLAAAGLSAFYKLSSPSLRAAGLGLLFPGAGLIAVCTIPSILAFIVSTALIPVVLFAWFGAGGVAFPLLLWTGTSVLAGFLARESLLDFAAPVWTIVCLGGISYITWQSYVGNSQSRMKRHERNQYLVESIQQSQAAAKEAEPGSRELDLRTLRFLQWIIELGLTAKDDFSYHDIIDQFQTSAIRYQLYEAVSVLGMYQSIYAPNFHGYSSQASRNIIEKSMTSKVVGFWKWESMWGKFNMTNWDPIYKDNIMVSGYILQAVGIYQSNTGDTRYNKPGSMVFEIDSKHKYEYDFPKLASTIKRNWDENDFCLFPCEPNWIYTPCNLVGISGTVLSDRLLGTSHGKELKTRFETALEEELSSQDGSILPIRSELTGFTIPGLAGALSDSQNSILCAAYLPHIAHRNWAFIKHETIGYTQEGKLELRNLVGADNLDPGNYKGGQGSVRAIFAAAAAEFGEDKLRKDLLKQLDEEFFPVRETPSGALINTGLSTLWRGASLRGRMSGYQDWTRMLQKGPPSNVLRGPILEEVPFPQVLVAKAYSHDGDSMELVVYNGKEAGTFRFSFTRLQPGAAYHLNGKSATASKDGSASWDIHVDGRTAMKLESNLRN